MVGCVPQEGSDWSGRYDVEGFGSSPGCLEEIEEGEAPARAIAVVASSSHLDVLLCEGEACPGPWWSGWVDSIGPKRVRGSVAQAMGSPSEDGTPRCSVAWSTVLMEAHQEPGRTLLEGEIWQADSVPMEPYFDCWEVLDAHVEEQEAQCAGAWQFSLANPL